MNQKHQSHQKCLSCNYQSQNSSEFALILESSEKHWVCLDCVDSDKKFNLPDYQVKIAESIRKRKEEHGFYLKGKVLVFEPQKNNQSFSNYQNSIVFPKQIKETFDKRIIGQENAKLKISTAIANHLRKVNDSSVTFEKSNILLIGPTGTGKTEFFRTISKEFSLPFTSCSATSLTAAGYVGQDVPQILSPLISSVDDIYMAQKGIVFIDEIDKIAGDGESSVNTIRVQQELLKMIEGDIVQVNIGESKNHPHYVDIDTTNILFICAGAFSGLKETVTAEEKSMGIQSSFEKNEKTKDWTKLINTKELTKYGLIPEFLGRLPVVTFTEELSIDLLEKILTQPDQNLVSQYKKLFNSYSVDVSFAKDFIRLIAEASYNEGLGARGLKKVMEERLFHIISSIDKFQNKSILILKDGEIELDEKQRYVRC